MVWSFLDILGIVLGSHEAWTLEHTRWGNRGHTQWARMEGTHSMAVVVALWVCELPVGLGGGD